MKRIPFIGAVIFAVILTLGGAGALVGQVDAASGLKSSVITFVITLGFALLGPSLLAAAVFFHRTGKNESRARQSSERVPATPKRVYRPYLHGH